jgi:protein gp37
MKLARWGDTAERRRTSVQNWKKPVQWNRKAKQSGARQRVFCGSLCDVFEDNQQVNMVREDLWGLIKETPMLDWQLLTKRPENIEKMLPLDWVDGWQNVWLGTTIEEHSLGYRAEVLASIRAACRFISYEPAIGSLGDTCLDGIHWLIYGGESGPGFRKDDNDWARQAKALCERYGTVFYYKQKSGFRPGAVSTLDGEEFHDFPNVVERWDARQTEFPLWR